GYVPTVRPASHVPSLTGRQSAGFATLLLSLEQPSPQILASIEAAVAWFQSVKLTGIKVVQKPDPNSPKGFNKVVVPDPNAPPLWARFYDLQTMKPIFSDRDGVAKPNLADIGYERRNGYAWLRD